MSTWNDLRELRAVGLAPGFPLVVAVGEQRLMENLGDIGAMTIQHKPGEVFPVELLDGLRVWLFLGDCGRAVSVTRAMKSKGVEVRELQTWCPCSRRLVSSPALCEVNAAWA
jgi:hypothetical protein